MVPSQLLLIPGLRNKFNKSEIYGYPCAGHNRQLVHPVIGYTVNIENVFPVVDIGNRCIDLHPGILAE